jgi:PHD finger protein 12 MRG binding domain/PHD-finger
MKENIAKEKEEIQRAQEQQEAAKKELERIKQQEEQAKLDLEKAIEEEAKAKEEADKVALMNVEETSDVVEEVKAESDPPILVEDAPLGEFSEQVEDPLVKEESELNEVEPKETVEIEPTTETMQVDVDPVIEPPQEVVAEPVTKPEVIVEVPVPVQEEKDPEPIKQEEEEEEIEIIHEVEEELTPLQELIRVARLLNPKQFELPPEMIEPFPFPGTERTEIIKNGRRVKNKRLVELDGHGCVPLPAKLCYACSKTCKMAPLISCDYCSLFFHQDCLDPPLTALPAGRWMCPNHPQHFIVSSRFTLARYCLTLFL